MRIEVIAVLSLGLKFLPHGKGPENGTSLTTGTRGVGEAGLRSCSVSGCARQGPTKRWRRFQCDRARWWLGKFHSASLNIGLSIGHHGADTSKAF